MKRVLIHINIVESGEYDIFNPLNYDILNQRINEEGLYCPNFGNRLWFQSIISMIQSEENEIEYYKYSMTKEYINANYDLIIAPMANVFAVMYKGLLNDLAVKFEGIKIPVYVVACGVQAANYNQLDYLSNELKDEASRFIESIYKTGGDFALRGYFTKSFFDQLGFSDAVVTGCPSLYQMGRDLKVLKKDVKESLFNPIVNGEINDFKKSRKLYPDVEFIDQHVFYNELFNLQYGGCAVDLNKRIKKLIKTYGLEATKWLCEGRIKLLGDMNTWRNYLINSEFNFSIGRRIHGNIMSILAGIPSVVIAHDSRTREMAEFFDIPFIMLEDYKKEKSLYQIFERISYQKFNDSFGDKYDSFQLFLKEKGIVESINDDNIFFSNQEINHKKEQSTDVIEEMKGLLDTKKNKWIVYDFILKANRRIRCKQKC